MKELLLTLEFYLFANFRMFFYGMIKRFLAREFVQSSQHKNNIINMYYIIYRICKDEFTEDNKPTLDFFMEECFREGKKGIWKNDN